MKEMEEELKEKLNYLSGFVVALRDHIHTDISIKPGNDAPSIPAHRALLVIFIYFIIYFIKLFPQRKGIKILLN